jgi:hypothetical protein
VSRRTAEPTPRPRALEAALWAAVAGALLPLGGAMPIAAPLSQIFIAVACVLGALRSDHELSQLGFARGWTFAWVSLLAACGAGLFPLPDWLLRGIAPGSATATEGWRWASLDGEATLTAALRLLGLFGFGLAVQAWAGTGRKRHAFEHAAQALAVALLAVAGLHLIAGARALFGVVPTSLAPGRPFFAPFVNANHFGALGVLLLPVVVGKALDHLRPEPSAAALARLGLAGALVAAVIGVHSVSVTLALVVQVAGWIARRYGPAGWSALGTSALAAVASSPWWADRFAPIWSGALAPRVHLWGDAVPLLRGWWLLGVGAGNFGDQIERVRTDCAFRVWGHAHNLAVEWWAETGLLGVVAGIAALAFALPGPARDGTRDARAVRIQLGLLGLAAHQCVDFSASLYGVALCATAAWVARGSLFAARTPSPPARVRWALLIVGALQAPAVLWGFRGAVADAAIVEFSKADADPEAAIRAAERLDRVAPWRPERDLGRAWAAHLAGQAAEATALASAVIADHPDDADALRQAGIALLRENDCAGGRAALEAARAQGPADWRNHATAARAATACGDRAASVASYARAFSCQAPVSLVSTAYRSLPMGVVWVSAVDPAPAAYAARLGDTLTRAGERQSAALAWDLAASRAPETWGTRVEWIEALLAAGRADDAAAALEIVRRERPHLQQLPSLHTRIQAARGSDDAATVPEVAATTPEVRQIRAVEATEGPIRALAALQRLSLSGASQTPELAYEEARLSLEAGDAPGCLAVLIARGLDRDTRLGPAANALRGRCSEAIGLPRAGGQ